MSVFDISANMTVSKTVNYYNSAVLVGYNDRTARDGAARAWALADEDNEILDYDRALLQFDTATIPLGDTISKVEVYQKFAETPTPSIVFGTPSFVVHYRLLASPLTLAASAETWDAGTLALETFDATDGKWLDLGPSAPALINRTGVTTLNYIRLDVDSGYYYDLTYGNYTQVGSSKLAVGGTPVQLRITHAPPPAPRKKWPFRAASLP